MQNKKKHAKNVETVHTEIIPDQMLNLSHTHVDKIFYFKKLLISHLALKDSAASGECQYHTDG